MSEIKVLDIQIDKKLNAYSIMTNMSIAKYLEITKSSEENIEIQRKIISTRKSKIYSRLIEDLKMGGIMPPIVLVLRNSTTIHDLSIDSVEATLSTVTPADISILDGLQRTNCIRKAYEELIGGDAEKTFLENVIRVEFWANMKFQAILYRMITLNAGQTPMSMNHQLEILNLNLKETIEKARTDIEIYTSNDSNRRTKSKQYQFSQLVEGYNAFINKSSYIDVKNQVVEELNRIDFLESYEKSNGELGLSEFTNTIADFDENISTKYNVISFSTDTPKYGYQILSKRTFFIGFCAALGRAYDIFGSDQFISKISALNTLINSDESDPLELETYLDLISSSSAKARIGEIERELVEEAFCNHLISNMDFSQSWKRSGSKVIKKGSTPKVVDMV